jgi:hypothetical protein
LHSEEEARSDHITEDQHCNEEQCEDTLEEEQEECRADKGNMDKETVRGKRRLKER